MVWLITFLFLALIVLAAGAKRRAGRRFDLPLDNPALSLAILKENLLENPSSANLEKLKEFAAAQNLEIPKEEYPLGKANSVESDSEVFLRQAAWLDFLTPLEFDDSAGGGQTEKNLAGGILRLYSDEKIFAAFGVWAKKYPSEKQRNLEEGYRNLCELRDSSGADYDSLEKLRIEKERWERAAREFL